MRRTLALATSLALSLGTLAACGGDDDDASGSPADDTSDTTEAPETDDTSTDDTEAPPADGGGGAVTLVGEDVQWDQDSYTAAAGEVSFVVENRDSIRHTLVIDGVDEGSFKLEVDSEGDTDEGSVELEAGEYELICDVPGHGSMRATLTVE